MKHWSRRCLLAVGLFILTAALPQGQTVVVETVEDRDHVAIMQFAGIYDRQPESNREYELAVRQAVAKEFFRTHAHDYDFLVIFTRFDYDLGGDAEGKDVRGRYYGIKNDTQGIGEPLFDNSVLFGSSGQLQGYIDMGVLSRLATDPTDPAFENTLSILAHEFAHRWAAHVRFRDADGNPSGALLGRDNSHWSFLLQSHNSVLYGNDWRQRERHVHVRRPRGDLLQPAGSVSDGHAGACTGASLDPHRRRRSRRPAAARSGRHGLRSGAPDPDRRCHRR